MKWRLDYGLDSRTIHDRQHTRALPFTGYIFGASVSEPHTSEFNCNFSYMYILLLLLLHYYFLSYVVPYNI